MYSNGSITIRKTKEFAREESLLKVLFKKKFQLNERMKIFQEFDLLEDVQHVDVLVSYPIDNINREVIEKAPRLKLITTYGAGFNSVDVACATERGIYVCNCPDVVSEATSDVAFYLMLACSRRATEAERYVREGNWIKSVMEPFLGMDLARKTLGIIGMVIKVELEKY